MRRIDDFQQRPGQSRVLTNQLGDGLEIGLRHQLLHLQINHDLRLGRHADAVQKFLNLPFAELYCHDRHAPENRKVSTSVAAKLST